MKLQTFLGRWKLESGGIFYAWYGVVKHALVGILSAYLAYTLYNTTINNVAPIIHGITAAVAILFIIFDFLLMKGVSTRSHKKVLPSMYASAYNTGSYIVQIFFSIKASNTEFMVLFIVLAVIEVYGLLIKRSLHDDFKAQPLSATNTNRNIA